MTHTKIVAVRGGSFGGQYSRDHVMGSDAFTVWRVTKAGTVTLIACNVEKPTKHQIELGDLAKSYGVDSLF